ncbi:hypothetical protein DV735_g1217, partial [Chaetothyriales sp. CBS 134920]
MAANTNAKAVAYLTGLLGKTLHVAVPDGRVFTGTFKCTDCDCNIVLSNAFEYSLPSAKAEALAKQESQLAGGPARANMTSRFLGLIVVPKQQVISIGLEQRPPKFGTPQFLSEIEPHLRIDASYQSPVLSFTDRVRYPMRIVDADPERALAVFDMLDLEEDLQDRFGKRGKPYLVPSVCKQYELYDLPGGYTGRGEWLVWGNIKCDPIVIFDQKLVRRLHQILSSMSELNRASGEQLGKLLKDVDDEHKEILARCLLKAFKVPGCDGNYHGLTWQEFVQALDGISSITRTISRSRTLHGPLSIDCYNMKEASKEGESAANSELAHGIMEGTLDTLKEQGRVVLREARSMAEIRADASILDGLDDWANLSPTPRNLTSPPPDAIDGPAALSEMSTQAPSIIDLTGESSEYDDIDSEGSFCEVEMEVTCTPPRKPQAGEMELEDDSFFEIKMEATCMPQHRQQEEHDGDGDGDFELLVIIRDGRRRHAPQHRLVRAKSQSVVFIGARNTH